MIFFPVKYSVVLIFTETVASYRITYMWPVLMGSVKVWRPPSTTTYCRPVVAFMVINLYGSGSKNASLKWVYGSPVEAWLDSPTSPSLDEMDKGMLVMMMVMMMQGALSTHA